jgi:hypothetical protein
MDAPVTDVDPFDLPDWLGTEEVVWSSDVPLRGSAHVAGHLSARGHDDLACDLLAVDQAFPTPVTDDATRLRAHQVWEHGQVLVVRQAGRLTLAAPGRRWGPDRTLETIARFARAVGATGDRFAVQMRVGG